MMSSSMTLSLIWLLPLWTMKMSFSRTDSSALLVSRVHLFTHSATGGSGKEHTNLDTRLAIGELFELRLGWVGSQAIAYRFH